MDLQLAIVAIAAVAAYVAAMVLRSWSLLVAIAAAIGLALGPHGTGALRARDHLDALVVVVLVTAAVFAIGLGTRLADRRAPARATTAGWLVGAAAAAAILVLLGVPPTAVATLAPLLVIASPNVRGDDPLPALARDPGADRAALTGSLAALVTIGILIPSVFVATTTGPHPLRILGDAVLVPLVVGVPAGMLVPVALRRSRDTERSYLLALLLLVPLAITAVVGTMGLLTSLVIGAVAGARGGGAALRELLEPVLELSALVAIAVAAILASAAPRPTMAVVVAGVAGLLRIAIRAAHDRATGHDRGPHGAPPPAVITAAVAAAGWIAGHGRVGAGALAAAGVLGAALLPEAVHAVAHARWPAARRTAA